MNDTFQVLVFSSNISDPVKVSTVRDELLKNSNVYHVNVDLEDWEYILRVEAHPEVHPEHIEEQIDKLGFRCFELTE